MNIATPEIDDAVRATLLTHPLARLAHFTPARNLPSILEHRSIRSTKDLDADVRAAYAKTDLARLDGRPDMVCCSLQYPNGFYFERARRDARARNFPDWVCLLLDRELAAGRGVLFSHRNAAAGCGAHLRSGVAGFLGCYAADVQGKDLYRRGPRHDPGSPTDIQAEVLVPAPIPLSAVTGIVVPSEAAAAQEKGRLFQVGQDPSVLRWIVSPGMFNKWAVTRAVRSSEYFTETPWKEA